MNRKEIENQLVEVSINVPSGKLVYADYLGNMYDIDEDLDVNQSMGRKQSTEMHAEKGLLHGYVGNSCPTIYKDGDKLSIGSRRSDKDKDVLPGESVGSICTDLWWFSLADYDDYVSKGGDPKHEYISVTPGRYLLKHKFDNKGSSDYFYATIEKSDADPKKWKLPEEVLEKEVFDFLPEKYKKIFFHVKVVYERANNKDGYVWTGYEISLSDLSNGGGMAILKLSPEFKETTEELSKKLVDEFENGIYSEKQQLEREKRSKEHGPLSASTKAKIRKMLRMKDPKPKKKKTTKKVSVKKKSTKKKTAKKKVVKKGKKKK